MRVSRLFVLSGFCGQLLLLMLMLDSPQSTAMAQEAAFELPVQLIGFPVIILAVRLANFVKKLSYSLNPSTYRSRVRRGALAVSEAGAVDQLDAAEAEKRLVAELGQAVCVYERVCAHYASKAQVTRGSKSIDWETVLSQYKRSPDRNKEFYLLSVFLGNIVGSPSLCHQLAKRGRACAPLGGWEQR